ncbi:ribonuclease H [Candidatus Kaiserbacteria bacterium CG_4_9_14_0_2_um_filter_41_32]|uniref:Ribonuclease H n=1 Tax=Candidatus Kaiserbacteria bacterium CG_4_9_14_0_2_um_filter_41_32 TaxID=1974601 RepID=A0A2M8FE83_9BACT|nr:MAG: ribonuclease H [Candidatus Kaiserbacteria bacterium CG_4_9_14_0_2_um_filter_41_32]
MKTIICYTDGGARGNPGPAAIGVYITDEKGVMVREAAQTIGNSTNNFAEYQAVLIGLQTLKQEYGKATKTMQFEIRLDSELVKKQLNAEYQIKEPGLVPMFIEIHNMRVANFPHLKLTHIPREKNKEADRLVNEALDGAR